MRKTILTSILCLLAASSAYAQMTDAQILDYLKQASLAGKSETQMARELLSRGATIDQIQNIKDKYSGKPGTLPGKGGIMDRERTGVQSMETVDLGGLSDMLDTKGTRDTLQIYGHSIFTTRSLSFEPNANMATPKGYILGPDDELIVDLWGYNETSFRQKISPEGRIVISQIGPVQLSGLTIEEAEKKIKKVLSSKYSGISGEETHVSVTLGNIRSIQVNVYGEVNTPGTYRISSFSTVFHAIYKAGGVGPEGSLRDIRIIRSGRQIAVADVYKFIFDGVSDGDIRLEEGDVIIVPSHSTVVAVSGGVRRPMRYEIKAGETLEDVIAYAGGFAEDGYRGYVSISRRSDRGLRTISAKEGEMASCLMADGDKVTVYRTSMKKYSGVEVRGYVQFPGLYSYESGVDSVRKLVEAAGGLCDDAFLNRAVIQREKEDLSLSTVSVPLGAIMDGSAPDIPLGRSDVLVVSGKYEIESSGILTINGHVARPGSFPFAENTTVEDLIIMAGGLLDGASLARVDVARRIVDSRSLEVPDRTGETFSFSIKDGLAVDGADCFVLKPYDIVSVRRSPGFQEQSFVKVTGQVAFPGEYVMLSREDRISDIISRAGGVTSKGYLKGAVLKRRMQDADRLLTASTMKVSQQAFGKDSLKIDSLSVNAYTVGVDFEKAVKFPGSSFDIIVRADDEILIPENLNTVRISGEVLFPNTVTFEAGKNFRYYINKAGGFTRLARESQVYIVYLNGSASKASRGSIEPGCEIIVPTRTEREPLRPAEIISIGSSTASLAAMVLSIINVAKR